jgi:hypothetical protein
VDEGGRLVGAAKASSHAVDDGTGQERLGSADVGASAAPPLLHGASQNHRKSRAVRICADSCLSSAVFCCVAAQPLIAPSRDHSCGGAA